MPDKRDDFYPKLIRQAGPFYPGFELATVEAALGVSLTYDLMHQCLARYMSEYGLSKSTLNILLILRHGPVEGMLLHDLGELLLVSRANITGLIDHLEEKGYVNRVVDASDRRARFARITAKAEALLDEFMPLHNLRQGALLKDLSGEDKRELTRLLKKMRASLHAHAAVCERQPVGATL